MSDTIEPLQFGVRISQTPSGRRAQLVLYHPPDADGTYEYTALSVIESTKEISDYFEAKAWAYDCLSELAVIMSRKA